jgi:dipeptidyl aminopeptidase/acylaminoacyl peptidase
MQSDLRITDLYKDIEALVTALRQPGTEKISDAAEINVSFGDGRAAFAGTIVDKLEGTPPTRICMTDLATGDTWVLTFGHNVDRSRKFSPDGKLIAVLSDRHKSGDFRLYLLEMATGAARSGPHVDGSIEYLHWSPDSKRILLGVAADRR